MTSVDAELRDTIARPAWARAQRLGERIASLRARGGDGPFARDVARAELELWRSQRPFDEERWFRARLAAAGIEERELATVLGEDLEVLAARTPVPRWLERLARLYLEAERAPRPLAFPSLERSRTAGFLEAARPLLDAARDDLARALRALEARSPGTFAVEPLVEQALEARAWRVHAELARPLVLELGAARLAGTLPGADGEERFAAFVDELRDPRRALAFLEGYPVLARRLVEDLERFVEVHVELFGHLVHDRGALVDVLWGGADPGPLVEASYGAGDTHRGGRSVALLRFASGARCVYKPRSLAVELHFQELLRWLAERGGEPLRRLRIVEAGDHGWVELVEPAPCGSPAALGRFHRRLGALLALLFVLEGTDVHFENLIAAGEEPVLVDLETLFHARPAVDEVEQPDQRLVNRATASSVLRVGLLPSRTWSEDPAQAVDLSGLGGAAGQKSPDRALGWSDAGTDAMRATREEVLFGGAWNRPRLEGEEPPSAAAFADDVAAGFADCYRLLARERDALAAPGGPLQAFASDELRSVLRATRGYGVLLQESLHPELCYDALELERFWDRLWVGTESAPHVRRVIEAERADLTRGDVPRFTTRADARDLWTSDGERLAGFWDASGLELAHRRLAALDEQDLERQGWILRASLSTLTLEGELLWPSYALARPAAPRTDEDAREEALGEARRIGERLARLALEDGHDRAWMGLVFAEGRWGLTPLTEDLYAGTPGVALFLAELARLTDDARLDALARQAMETYYRRLALTIERVRSPGAFNGLAGILWALAHLQARWRDAASAQWIERLLQRLPAAIEADRELDVIGGVAGAAAVLAGLPAARPGSLPLALAKRCGERLLEHASPIRLAGDEVPARAWFTTIESEHPLTGFSHGAAGISFALCRLARRAPDERLCALALDAVRYERSRFVAEERNWMDAPDPQARPDAASETQSALSMAWCYGAPGIALARLDALPELAGLPGGRLVREDLDVALATTLSRGFGRNHSLCHGDLGNLDVVGRAAERLADPALVDAWRARRDAVLASLAEHGRICGVPQGVEAPALMNGLAGIGMGLLRIARPASVPSVLALDPPPDA